MHMLWKCRRGSATLPHAGCRGEGMWPQALGLLTGVAGWPRTAYTPDGVQDLWGLDPAQAVGGSFKAETILS